MSKVTVNFSQLDQREERTAVGEYIRVDQADGPVEIWIEGRFLATLKKGQKLKTDKFTGFALVNKLAGVNDVVLAVGTGDVEVSDMVIAAMPAVDINTMPDQTVNVGLVAPTPVNESPDTPDLIIPAGQTVAIHDPVLYSCESVAFWAEEGNLYNLRVWTGGDGSVVQGGYLAPGGYGNASGALVIWVHNPSAVDQAVALHKEKRV